MSAPRRPLPKNLKVVRLPHEPLPTSREAVVLPTINRGGRPPIYNADFHCKMVTSYRLLGLTAEQMAALFNIDVQTFYAWKDKFPRFSQAWDEGGEIADAAVAASLNHRARGYTHRALHISTQWVGDGEGGGSWQEHIIEYDKHYPPDTMAATKWLACRQKHWRLASQDREDEANNVVIVKVIGGLPQQEA